jgi:hypothetical protein
MRAFCKDSNHVPSLEIDVIRFSHQVFIILMNQHNNEVPSLKAPFLV